jgi:hypothetical protein
MAVEAGVDHKGAAGRLDRDAVGHVAVVEAVGNTAAVVVGFLDATPACLVHRVACITKYVHIYTEYHSVCPLAGIRTLPTPLSPPCVPLPPNQRGVAHSPAGEGVGESRFRRLEKSLALCLLCGLHGRTIANKSPLARAKWKTIGLEK